MYSRHQYNQLADHMAGQYYLRKSEDSRATVLAVTSSLCALFRDDNPRFDAALFMTRFRHGVQMRETEARQALDAPRSPVDARTARKATT